MLSKHSVIYFLGRGVPGLINFLALGIYTRLVLPAEYGTYALIITTVNLFNAVLFQWIRLVILRFYPACESDNSKVQLNGTVLFGYSASLVISLLALAFLQAVSVQQIETKYVILGCCLLPLQALFEIGLDFYRSLLQPKQYAYAHLFKATLAIGLGAFLAYVGLGTIGLLTGLVIACFIAIVLFFKQFLNGLRLSVSSIDWRLLRKHLHYGVPLTASSALAFIMDSSDRYLVNYYLGQESTGAYAVGYDLARQTLWVIMTSISLASYPLVIRALEKDGRSVANQYLKSNYVLLIAVAMPIAVGMAVLSPELAGILVGVRYSDTVAMLMPYVAIGSLMSGLKSFYIDQSFQLARKTRLQLWSVAIAAMSNVVLNMILLPRIGLIGAAYSTLLSYSTVLIISCLMSRFAYRLPLPWVETGKVFMATIIMACVVLIVKPHLTGIWGIMCVIAIAGGVYGSLLMLLRVVSADSVIERLSVRKKQKNYA